MRKMEVILGWRYVESGGWHIPKTNLLLCGSGMWKREKNVAILNGVECGRWGHSHVDQLDERRSTESSSYAAQLRLPLSLSPSTFHAKNPSTWRTFFLPTMLFNLLETVISPLLLVSLSHSYSSYSPTRLDSLPMPSPLPPHSLLTPSPSLPLSLHTRDLICATGGNLP